MQLPLWYSVLWLIPLGFIFVVIGVPLAQQLRQLPSVQSFSQRYPTRQEPHSRNVNSFGDALITLFRVRTRIVELPAVNGNRHEY